MIIYHVSDGQNVNRHFATRKQAITFALRSRAETGNRTEVRKQVVNLDKASLISLLDGDGGYLESETLLSGFDPPRPEPKFEDYPEPVIRLSPGGEVEITVPSGPQEEEEEQ